MRLHSEEEIDAMSTTDDLVAIAVAKDDYASVQQGLYCFTAGYKPGLVVVYINMNGAILMKPIQLLLSHWCVRAGEVDF